MQALRCSSSSSSIKSARAHPAGLPAGCAHQVVPCTRGRSLLARAQETETQQVETEPGKTKAKVGFRYDGTMMRWIRDDRLSGKEVDTTVQPMSGAAYTVWPVVHAELMEQGLRSVTAKEAHDMQQQGWTIVDVRVEDDFAYDHAAGAVSLPLYRYVQGNDFWDKVKRGVMMIGFAMRATERDPDFIEKAKQQLAGKKLIVTCAIGGTLDTKLRLRNDKYKDGIDDADRAFGRESRALKACYELFQAGWTSQNMVFMEGGFQQWRHQGFPTEESA